MWCPFRRHRKTKTLISILVPFGGHDPFRVMVWKWLRRYYEYHLHDYEIIMGTDNSSVQSWHRRHPKAFSKSAAINNAFKHSHGDIIVILDADCYIDPRVIMHWAERLRAQRRAGIRSWAVPYRYLLRLTEDMTKEVLRSSPDCPFYFTQVPPSYEVEGSDGSGWGHVYGALIQILPREAFVLVGGWDERFRGWGGEDRAFLQKLDALWGHYQNSPNVVYHLWHPKFIAAEGMDKDGRRAEIRSWEGQKTIRSNDWLSWQYEFAKNDPTKMRQVMDEHK